MKITWLGQAGLLFDSGRRRVMIDPYLSDRVAGMDPKKRRRIPVDEAVFGIRPDILILTHNHADHYDPATVTRFVGQDTHVTVIAPFSVWQEVRRLGGARNNYVCVSDGCEWTEYGFRVRAVRAWHSDPYAIGAVLTEIQSGDNYYITGDTLYNAQIADEMPARLKAVFLPVNGAGNNMNAADAARFAALTGAEYAVPLHFGLLDDLDAGEFDCANGIIPEIWQEIRLGGEMR